MYSKRWELMHILGGGCKECGNQNFYDLEIDHIYNDGEGERTYYTNLDARYVKNPKRAKQRLQILCKECHKDKHAPVITKTPKEQRTEYFRLFIDTLKTLEGPIPVPVPREIICEAFSKVTGFDYQNSTYYLNRMLREASIYESKPEHYNTI